MEAEVEVVGEWDENVSFWSTETFEFDLFKLLFQFELFNLLKMEMCLGVFLDAFLERRFLEEVVVLLLF